MNYKQTSIIQMPQVKHGPQRSPPTPTIVASATPIQGGSTCCSQTPSAQELLESLPKPPPLQPPLSIDDHAQFWSTYDKVTGTFDREILDAWNKSLDVLLIFGALFSAINTAFIIESYKGLQPDPAEITNELLRLLLAHRNDNITFSVADLHPGSPAPFSTPVNAIFFSSLSFSLTAAFGAVTAKQWLTEYAGVGAIIAPHEQGRRRQEKYRGLKIWHLRLIIELLPILLQISLFLFLVGVGYFLWPLNKGITILQAGLSGAGIGIYLISIGIGVVVPTSPFQTPLSKYVPRCLSNIRHLFKSLPKRRDILQRTKFHWRTIIERISGHDDLSSLGHCSLNRTREPVIRSVLNLARLKIVQGPNRMVDWVRGWGSRKVVQRKPMGLKVEGPHPKDMANAECVLWLLENAEHPDVTITALDALTRLPPTLLYSLLKERTALWERMVSYHRSLLPHKSINGLGWLKLWPDSAVISGMALCHVIKGRGPKEDPLKASSLPYVGWSPMDGDEIDARAAARLAISCFMEIQSETMSSSSITLLDALHFAIPNSLEPFELSIPMTDVRQSLTHPSFITSPSSLPLLLDSVVHAARQKKLRRRDNQPRIEEILRSLHTVLLNRPTQDIVDHIIIALAEMQRWSGESPTWSPPATPNQIGFSFEERPEYSTIELNRGKRTLDNVSLALSVVDEHMSQPAVALYQVILSITEDFFHRNDFYNVTPNFASSLIQLAKQSPESVATRHRIIRLLSQRSSGDWNSIISQDVDAVAGLLHSILGLWPSSTDEHTVTAVGRLLGQIKLQSTPDRLEWLIVSPEGLHRDKRVIARLRSLLSDKMTLARLRSLRSDRDPLEFYAAVLQLPLSNSANPSILLDMQIELAVGLLSLYEAENDDSLVYFCMEVQGHFNRMMEQDPNLRWPEYFTSIGIIATDDGTGVQEPLNFIEPETLVNRLFISNPDLLFVWKGEGLVSLLRNSWKWKQNGQFPNGWDDSAFFEAETVDTMLDYCAQIMKYQRDWIDRSTLVEYFERAKDIDWSTKEEFRGRLSTTQDENSLHLENLRNERPGRIDHALQFFSSWMPVPSPIVTAKP